MLPNDHPHPIHILLDRFDGRTKDYMVSEAECSPRMGGVGRLQTGGHAADSPKYVEVASVEAAREVLQTRQNTFMPGGILSGRKRPVTITQVTHAELLAEVSGRLRRVESGCVQTSD